MEPLIDALLEWISEHSQYVTDDLPHPQVLTLSPQDLTREYYAGVMHLLPDDGVDERLNAIFSYEDGPNGTVFILAPEYIDGASDFDRPSDNPLFREILLHELVHFVQWRSGALDSWPCLAIGETEAYALGGVYLRQTYTPDPLPNRAFWGQMYARC